MDPFGANQFILSSTSGLCSNFANFPTICFRAFLTTELLYSHRLSCRKPSFLAPPCARARTNGHKGLNVGMSRAASDGKSVGHFPFANFLLSRPFFILNQIESWNMTLQPRHFLQGSGVFRHRARLCRQTWVTNQVCRTRVDGCHRQTRTPLLDSRT
jgi:hypothetical protein